MWTPIEHRLALLELVVTGALPRRRAQEEAWRWLRELPWTRATSRRDERALVDEAAVRQLLDRVWPDWPSARDHLAQAGLPPTPTGWRDLEDLMRARRVGDLPRRLNRRTALSEVGPHSKATLTRARRAALGETEVTRDGLVRLRPPAGLRFRRGGVEVEAGPLSAVLGELGVSDRALRDGTELVGDLGAVLTVENLGAFQDLAPPAGWLVAYVAGWDTATVRLLLERLRVPVVHFGDLDPNGVRIVRHLREVRSDLRWAVPGFWVERVEAKGQPGEWPEDLDLADAPPLVRRLARDGLWLEQESIVLDPRLPAGLEAALDAQAPT